MDTITILAFVNRERITIDCEYVDSNPNMPDSENMNHWKCKLTRRTVNGGRRSMTVYFSMGYGLSGKPKATDVLDCLASDASSADQDFESWASDYGYDTDSRKAEQTYKTVAVATRKLKAFLGPDAFHTLVNHTERL